jgi:hypothetical protein
MYLEPESLGEIQGMATLTAAEVEHYGVSRKPKLGNQVVQDVWAARLETDVEQFIKRCLDPGVEVVGPLQ